MSDQGGHGSERGDEPQQNPEHTWWHQPSAAQPEQGFSPPDRQPGAAPGAYPPAPPYPQPPFGDAANGAPYAYPYPQQPPPPYGRQYGQPYGQPYGAPPTYGYQAMPVPGGRIASMAARLGGLVVDAIVVSVPLFAIGAFVGAYDTASTCNSDGVCTNSYQFSSTWSLNLIALLIGALYSGLLVGLTGRTLGHRAAGIRVVDVNTGALIGFPRAALRWVVLGLTGAICTLGYWSPFFDKLRRQGWHDRAARSVVIPAR